MSTFTLSTTQKNKPLVLSKGFSYTIDKTTNDKTYWKCEDARKLKCKGRVHTNNINTILLHENDSHNHNGSAVSTEIRLFEEKVRDRAMNCNEATQTVIDNCLVNLSDNAIARLPNFKHVKKTIQIDVGKTVCLKFLMIRLLIKFRTSYQQQKEILYFFDMILVQAMIES